MSRRAWLGLRSRAMVFIGWSPKGHDAVTLIFDAIMEADGVCRYRGRHPAQALHA